MSRARSLSRLGNENVFSVDASNNVGINSIIPDAKLDVDGTVMVGAAITLGGASGIVSATAFYGDGSNLDGITSAGLGTALAETGAGSVVYYTDKVLTVDGDVTIDPPGTTNIAYTQYAEIAVADSYDLTVADGDDFLPDVLGLTTETVSLLGSSGGRVRADNFTNHAGDGAPTFQTGLQVTGIVTATGSIQVGSGQSFGSSGASDAVYYGDGSNLTGVSAGLAASTITLQTWLFGGG